jgi:hypothetical protein
MNTKISFNRFAFALVLALSTLGLATSIALAQKPVKSEFTLTWDGTLTKEFGCAFDIHVDSIANITETDFLDQNGSLRKWQFHIVQQDTYTANRKSLTGVPFAYNASWLFDSDGQVTNVYADGVSEKIWLPDGSLFICAGRMDFVAHGLPAYMLSPDHGNPGNIAKFCAALAP